MGLAVLLAGFFMLQSNSASAYGLKASTVLEKMDSKQTNAYVTGIIEGLAYARYIKEGTKWKE